ncbi:cytochrome P450 monooxygenase [Fusarium albosuccineum]|uniref:Cytochrome P450 monooxygenase n=1 Tax=Fusarium albosuccineum TaxID=1237068 RepID=A0A8H4P897_9HYPO|nr:cytochrome P450 monooxygenase [Fusarium albosuccineum]
MSFSSEKRRQSSRKPAERKKAQNRAAQRSFREKQQAYIQYLESVADTLKTSQDGSGPEDRYDRLLKIHMALLEDHRRLHDSFIVLRQKLTSIGENALATAEDASLDALPATHDTQIHDRTLVSNEPSVRIANNQDLGYLSRMPPVQTNIHEPEETEMAGLASQFLFNSDMSSLAHFLQDPVPPPTIGPAQGLHHGLALNTVPIVASKTLFADKVEAACKKYMSSTFAPGSDLATTVDRLASAAIRLIGDRSGLMAFMYGTNFYECLEQVLRWRLCNTPETRASVLDMFKPTPLQYTSTDHPIIIDFITWPAIRDQLILHRQSLDLDALCRDLTLHTVVEDADKCVAVRVYEFMLREMSNEAPPQSCLDSAGWTYLQLDMDSPYQASVDPAEDMILHELQCRLGTAPYGAPSMPNPAWLDLRSAEFGGRNPLRRSVYQLQKWKLDPDFAWKWPVIDCSGGMLRISMSYLVALVLTSLQCFRDSKSPPAAFESRCYPRMIKLNPILTRGAPNTDNMAISTFVEKLQNGHFGVPTMTVLGLTAVAYLVLRCFYNYFFHPLSIYPGPKLAAVSELWYARHWLSKRWAFTLLDVSQKYGDVIRIAPNELFFTSIKAFEDIYGHANHQKGRKPFLKSEFYDNPDEMSPLGAERDPARHRETRKLLAHSFSESALSQQVPYIMGHVDLFMEQLAKHGQTPKGVNWFNWLTFDIIGDLAFGESFHAVEEIKSNPAITALMNVLFTGSVVNIFRRLPILLPFAPFILPISQLKKERAMHQEYARELMQRRISKGNDRPDFFGHLLQDEATRPSEEFLRTNASSLLIAGSETTATGLVGMTYFLLERPECLAALQEEVRSAFQTQQEINESSTRDLPYVNAVIKEALRIFVPLPINVPRVSPGGFVDGRYIPAGVSSPQRSMFSNYILTTANLCITKTIVSCHQYSLGHSPEYFSDPESFHPERWLPENHPLYSKRYATDNLEASKPFLIGPRTCLGKNLAYLEMRIILSKLILLFDWEPLQTLGPGKEVDWYRDVRVQFLWAKPDLRIRYIPRMPLQ